MPDTKTTLQEKIEKCHDEVFSQVMSQCFPDGNINMSRVEVKYEPLTGTQYIFLDDKCIGFIGWKREGNTITFAFEPLIFIKK